MFVSHQVSKSFLERLIADYQDLYQSLQLVPSDTALEMRRLVRIKLEAILSMKASSGEGCLEPQLQRTLKLELRSSQRAWTRHLVTSARLKRQRADSSAAYMTPVAAA